MRRLAIMAAITALTVSVFAAPSRAADTMVTVIKSETGDPWENLTVSDSGAAVLSYNDNSETGEPGHSQSGWINSMKEKQASPNPVNPARPNITNSQSDLDALFGSGAELIWEQNPVRNPKTGDVVKFTKHFDTGYTIIDSGGAAGGTTKIYLSVDNAFIVYLNGQFIGCSDRTLSDTGIWRDFSGHPDLDSLIVSTLDDMGDDVIFSTNHVRVYSFDIPADYFKRGGTNTLDIYAANKRVDVSQGDFSWDGKDGNYGSNPAFIMYAMTVESRNGSRLEISKEWHDYTGARLSDQEASGLSSVFKVSDSGGAVDLSGAELSGGLSLLTDGLDGFVKITGNGSGFIAMDNTESVSVEEFSSLAGYAASGGYDTHTGAWEFVNTERALTIGKIWLLDAIPDASPDNTAIFSVQTRAQGVLYPFDLSNNSRLIKNHAETIDAANGIISISGPGSLTIRFAEPGTEFVVTEIDNGGYDSNAANTVQSTVIGDGHAIIFTNSKVTPETPAPGDNTDSGEDITGNPPEENGTEYPGETAEIPETTPPLAGEDVAETSPPPTGTPGLTDIPDTSPPLVTGTPGLVDIPDTAPPLTGAHDNGALCIAALLLISSSLIVKGKKERYKSRKKA